MYLQQPQTTETRDIPDDLGLLFSLFLECATPLWDCPPRPHPDGLQGGRDRGSYLAATTALTETICRFQPSDTHAHVNAMDTARKLRNGKTVKICSPTIRSSASRSLETVYITG